jgi:DNA-binding CsgD family transcriptional regulator
MAAAFFRSLFGLPRPHRLALAHLIRGVRALLAGEALGALSADFWSAEARWSDVAVTELGSQPGDSLNVDHLTERERECLRLVGLGHESKDIARVLGCSPHTVDTHIRSASRKLGVSRRKEAARLLAASEAGPPTQWLSSPSQALHDTPPRPAMEDQGCWPEPVIPAQVLNDGEGFDCDPFPSLPPRRWYEGLFRRRGERINDLTTLETLRSVLIALFLMAAATFLIIKAMADWH